MDQQSCVSGMKFAAETNCTYSGANLPCYGDNSAPQGRGCYSKDGKVKYFGPSAEILNDAWEIVSKLIGADPNTSIELRKKFSDNFATMFPFGAGEGVEAQIPPMMKFIPDKEAREKDIWSNVPNEYLKYVPDILRSPKSPKKKKKTKKNRNTKKKKKPKKKKKKRKKTQKKK
jgi:uncharacterized spore protein YtfJ